MLTAPVPARALTSAVSCLPLVLRWRAAYYCAAAIGVRFPQILRKNITNLQLSQMVLGMALVCYNMRNCNGTPRNNQFGFAMYASYFALFLNFWVQQYVLAPRAKAKAAKAAKSS